MQSTGIPGGRVTPQQEVTVVGKVPESVANVPGLVEGWSEGIILAASLNQPDEKGRILLRCMNTTDQPLKLKAGAIVGKLHAIEERDIQQMGSITRKTGPAGGTQGNEVPRHLQDLYARTCGQLEHPDQSRDMGPDGCVSISPRPIVSRR